MKILDGKGLSKIMKSEIAEKVNIYKKETKRQPHLAAILVGNDGASETYVNSKVKDCEEVGFQSSLYRFDNSIKESELLFTIDTLNDDVNVDGILVQLPLPKHVNVERVIERIKPEKDVDGFHPINVGRMTKNLPAFISATPYGILKLLERNNIDAQGKHCVVLGRSDIVGRPMSILMSRSFKTGNSTVTLCHSKTKNLKEFTKQADILIVALGKAEYVTADMVKEGAVVIDVGITRITDKNKKSGYRLLGDVKFDEVSKKAGYITPVPGGVGPMTRVALLLNTLKAAKNEIYPK